MFGSPSFIEPGQLRNPSAQLQRAQQQQLAMPTNPSPAAVGLLNRGPMLPPNAADAARAALQRAAAAGVAKLPQPAQPTTGVVPPQTFPNANPAPGLQGLRAMRQPMGFGQAIRQPQNPPLT